MMFRKLTEDVIIYFSADFQVEPILGAGFLYSTTICRRTVTDDSSPFPSVSRLTQLSKVVLVALILGVRGSNMRIPTSSYGV